MAPIDVLAVVSEIFPLIKTGGLADVAGALPGALAADGITVRSLVPGYPRVLDALEGGVAVATLDDLFGGSARIVAAHAAGLDLFVIDAPHLYARDGDPYRGPDGRDWPDNAFRFAALSRAAALLAQGQVAGYRPDVVHAHDWQAGLAPAYLHYAGAIEPPTVMTIHNLAFQGRFPAYLLAFLGLPAEAFTIHGVEYYGEIGYLKAGLQFADRITTVSPTYAAEIRTPAGGVGMDGLLRTRADVLSGILNGIDTTVWDPARDPYLAAAFDADRPARACREQGGAAGAVRPAARSGEAAVRRDQPNVGAEGDRSAARRPAHAAWRWRCSLSSSVPARRRWKRVCVPPPPPTRRMSARRSATMRAWHI